MSEWSLVYEGFNANEEGVREALCTLGNGYFATRGAAPEAIADGVHYPGTYAAGCYNRRRSRVSGRMVENECMVNLPNWLPLTFRIEEGAWFDLRDIEILDYRQELDLRRGLLTRVVRIRDEVERVTRVAQRRFVSMADPHVAGLETTLVAENWSGRVEVRSGLDGRVINGGVARYRDFNNDHLIRVKTTIVDDETISVLAETSQSHIQMAETAWTRLACGGATAQNGERRVVRDGNYIAQELSIDVVCSDPVTIEKVVTLFTSKDGAISEPRLEASSRVRRLEGFEDLVQRHAIEWGHLWSRFALEIEGEEFPRLALHLNIFHLLQTASRNTIGLDVGVPARGLHGEAYRGHVFWDELFIFPYLNFHLPELTRSILLYRCRRLPKARWAASRARYKGAMYPWQSGSDSREETPILHLNPRSGRWLPDASRLQRHVNAAVAYNIWSYYQSTDDVDFLATYGAEVILEIARFWSSIATYNRSLDRYEIRKVMGPDEYHDGYPTRPRRGINNNAYTNVMAVWVLCRALEVVEVLPEPRGAELRESLGIQADEIARWEDVSRKMRLVFHQDGVISQFEGYEALKELDWEGYRRRYGDISRLDRILEAEGDTTNAYKASKQADVLMLFYLLSGEELRDIFERLGYPFDYEAARRNIDYYLQRTSHGSSLSRVVHSWVLARSDRERSWKFFFNALQSEVDDIHAGATAEGIHLGAMAGAVDLVQRCYTGIETRGEILWLDPLLPAELVSLRLAVRYRRQWVKLDISAEELRVSSQAGNHSVVRVGMRDKVVELRPGESASLKL